MKTRTLVSIFILVLAVLVIIGSCATDQIKHISKDYEIYGTWVNPDYNELFSEAKLAFSPDGNLRFYGKDISTDYEKAEFIITNKWFDSKGNVWYTYRYKLLFQSIWVYVLVKISDSGKTLEFAEAGSDYPTEINPENTTYRYQILYRQE